MFDNKDHLLECLYKALPENADFHSLDTSKANDAIYFNIGDTRWRVSVSGLTEEVRGNMLVSTQHAKMFKEALEKCRHEMRMKQQTWPGAFFTAFIFISVYIGLWAAT